MDTLDRLKNALKPDVENEMTLELQRRKIREIEDAINYILIVTEQQGYLMDMATLYGDGTQWKTLSRTGFNMVWECVEQTLKERGTIN